MIKSPPQGDVTTSVFNAYKANIMPYKGTLNIAFGDSITWGQTSSGTQSTKNWPTIFSNLTESTTENYAVPGTCMAVGNGYGITPEINNNAFCNRVDGADFTPFDTIFITYGTNDYGFVIDMGVDSVHSKTTFRGALHYSFTKLATDWPTKKVVVLTPMYSNTSLTKNFKGYTMLDYVEAIKDVTSQYGIPVIDLHRGMGINSTNISMYYWDNSLHPNDSTYEYMGRYIAEHAPGSAMPSKETVKSLMPVTGGNNLIKYGDFNPTGTADKFSNVIREKGVTFSILPGVTKASNAFLKVIPGETLYLTYWSKSLGDSQYYEADLYSSSTLVTSSRYIQTGEELVTLKFEIPLTADPATDYQLRFTTGAGNISSLDFSSLMLTRSNIPMLWSPAPGEETEMWFKAITVTAPTTNGATVPSYRKNGNGNVQLRGVVNVAGTNVITTLPVEARPQYSITTTIIAADGTMTYAIVSITGTLSVGTLNKAYDLASIPPYFAGQVDVR